MALPSPDEVNAMMAAEAGKSTLPSPAEIDAMMQKEAASKEPSSFGLVDALMSGLPGRDEVSAAGTAFGNATLGKGLDLLTGNNYNDGTIGELYDRALTKTRGEEAQYFKDNPVLANIAAIAGSATFPLGEAKTAMQAAKASGIMGGLYGFAGGEGGFENRAKSGGAGAALGAALGGTLHAASNAASDIADSAAALGKSTWNKIFGITSSDIRQSLNKGVRQAGDEAPIIQSFKDLADEGAIKPGNALANRSAVETQLKELNKEVPKILSTADSVQPTALVPTFDNAKKYIVDHVSEGETAAANKALEEIINPALSKKALLSEWQSEQSKLSGEGAKTLGLTGSDAVKANLKKYVALDIKQSIDKELANPVYSQALGEDAIRAIQAARKSQYDRYQVLPSLISGEARELASGGIEKAIRKSVSAVGYGIPAYVGYKEDGLSGALKYGVGAALLRSTLAQKAAAGVLENAIAPAIKGASKIVPAAAMATQALATDSVAKAVASQKQKTPAPIQPVLPTPAKAAAPANKVDVKALVKKQPAIIQAIIRQESTGNANAVSGKGARGLMQLMPDTAKELGITDIHDPVQNIDGGTRYVNKMLKKYKDVKLALAAYNAGPGTIDSYARKAMMKGKSVTWENIKKLMGNDYQETQNYVSGVLGHYKNLKG
mgnify:FL=1